MPKRLITVHGINTTGQWQDEIQEILGPHFDCVSIKYRDYRWLGETKILFDPGTLLIGLALSFYLRRGLISLFAYLLATISIAILISYLRRIRTLRHVKADIDKLVATGKPPHVIAHSFGTYFIGRLIAEFPTVRVDHLILTGCVLKRSTPWSAYLRDNPKAVKKIRNEMAGKDLVAKMAMIFYGFFPGLGHAGYAGFKDSAHDVDPHSGCGIECTTLVHNVRLGKLGHSDVFVGRGHAQRFWLPFLWGLDPKDYEDFVEMCVLADECEREHDWLRLGVVEDELRNRRWRWTNNFTLNDYLRDQIQYLLKRNNTQPLRRRIRYIRDLAVREMWQIVARADEAQSAEAGMGDPALIRNLHPKIAAIFALNAADR